MPKFCGVFYVMLCVVLNPRANSRSSHKIGTVLKNWRTFCSTFCSTLCSIKYKNLKYMRLRLRERDNARNIARCTKARKATHGLDGQHQDVDRTLLGRVNQNDRGQGQMEKVRPWCGWPTVGSRTAKRTEQESLKVMGNATIR